MWTIQVLSSLDMSRNLSFHDTRQLLCLRIEQGLGLLPLVGTCGRRCLRVAWYVNLEKSCSFGAGHDGLIS